MFLLGSCHWRPESGETSRSVWQAVCVWGLYFNYAEQSRELKTSVIKTSSFFLSPEHNACLLCSTFYASIEGKKKWPRQAL